MYVFSFGSTKHGGFLELAPCEVMRFKDDLYTIKVERKIHDIPEIDYEYEVYKEQLYKNVPQSWKNYLKALEEREKNFSNVVNFRTGKPDYLYVSRYVWYDWPQNFSEGDSVYIHARQHWNKVLPNKIKGIVAFDQIGASVIVKVVDNSVELDSIEVYEAQLTRRRH